METIQHYYYDSLSAFLVKNPKANQRDWIKQLNEDDLHNLTDLLKIHTEVGDKKLRFIIHTYVCWLPVSHFDISYLSFRINNIGKKRRILTVDPKKRIKILDQLLNDAQLLLINKGII